MKSRSNTMSMPTLADRYVDILNTLTSYGRMTSNDLIKITGQVGALGRIWEINQMNLGFKILSTGAQRRKGFYYISFNRK